MEGPLQPTRVADRLAAMDKDIRGWGRQTVSHLTGQLLSLNLQGQVSAVTGGQSLEESLNYHTKRQDGEIERISIRFNLYGMFLEEGVGKRRKAGSVEARRARKQWLSPIIPGAVESLADLLAENYADVVAESTVLNVPGFINTKVRKS